MSVIKYYLFIPFQLHNVHDSFLALTTDGVNFIMNSQEICNVINQCHEPKEAAQRISEQVKRKINFWLNWSFIRWLSLTLLCFTLRCSVFCFLRLFSMVQRTTAQSSWCRLVPGESTRVQTRVSLSAEASCPVDAGHRLQDIGWKDEVCLRLC